MRRSSPSWATLPARGGRIVADRIPVVSGVAASSVMAASVSLRLAMFDCDGTLVDSQHTIFAAAGAHAIVESFAALPPAVRELLP